MQPRLSLRTIYIALFMEGLILLPEYGFGVQVRLGKVLGTQDCLTHGSASTHCVLCLNLVKGKFNIYHSRLTDTLTCIQHTIWHFIPNPNIHLLWHCIIYLIFKAVTKQTYTTQVETSQDRFKHHVFQSKAWHTYLHIYVHQK